MITNLIKYHYWQQLDTIVWSTDKFKMMLLDNNYIPQPTVHKFANSIQGYEINSTNMYENGGKDIGTITLIETPDGLSIYKASVEWSTEPDGFSARFAVLYRNTGNPFTSDLIGVLDFAVDMTNHNKSLSILLQPDATFEVN